MRRQQLSPQLCAALFCASLSALACNNDPVEASGSGDDATGNSGTTAGETDDATSAAEGGTMEGSTSSNGDGDGDGDPSTSTTGDGDGDPSTTGDGDGDPSTTGDGDGDPSSSTTGDGDGDPTTTGDGDGDPSTTGDGDGDPSTTGDGDGDPSTTGDGDGDPTTTGDGDGDPTTTGDGDGDPTGDGDGDCIAWAITYNLDGSVFDISNTPLGAGDGSYTCAAPYDDPGTIGPGAITMYFQDVGGQPAGGPAQLIDYQMTLNFVSGGGGTTVTNTLETFANDSCGAAVGSLTSASAQWSASPDTLFGYTTQGNINCAGFFCGVSGAPEAGDTPVDETVDISPFSQFQFAADLSNFSGTEFVISDDSAATTTMTLQGVETGRTMVMAPPCICN